MSIFSRLFGSSKERELKKLLAETSEQVGKEYKPIGEVGKAIIQASVNCRDAVKNLINGPTEKERQKREIFIFYEFIYFYIHLTMRQAFGQLTESQMQKIQNYLGPLISSVAIDSYFAHWPDDLKQKMTDEFYEKLNDTELEYTECTQFDKPAAGQDRSKEIYRALFTKLCSNIVNLADNEEADEEASLALIPLVMDVALNELTKMHLGKLISTIKVNN